MCEGRLSDGAAFCVRAIGFLVARAPALDRRAGAGARSRRRPFARRDGDVERQAVRCDGRAPRAWRRCAGDGRYGHARRPAERGRPDPAREASEPVPQPVPQPAGPVAREIARNRCPDLPPWTRQEARGAPSGIFRCLPLQEPGPPCPALRRGGRVRFHFRPGQGADRRQPGARMRLDRPDAVASDVLAPIQDARSVGSPAE